MLEGIQVISATSLGLDPDSSAGLDPELLTRVVEDMCPQSQQLQHQITQVGKAVEETVQRNELCHTSYLSCKIRMITLNLNRA